MTNRKPYPPFEEYLRVLDNGCTVKAIPRPVHDPKGYIPLYNTSAGRPLRHGKDLDGNLYLFKQGEEALQMAEILSNEYREMEKLKND